MAPAVHPGRLLHRELAALKLSANRLALDLGVPSGSVTDILNSRRSITADTALRLALYFGNTAQFWLDLQSQHDIAVVECKRGAEIKKRVHPVDAARGNRRKGFTYNLSLLPLLARCSTLCRLESSQIKHQRGVCT